MPPRPPCLTGRERWKAATLALGLATVPGMASHSSPRPPNAKRSNLPGFLGSLAPKQLAAIGGVIVIILGVVIGILVSGGSGPKTAARPPVTVAPLAGNRCPLTDQPVASVPQRPALAVKVGNEPQGARPQSGLNEADIVYDTPAEGFIMRYVAVFQCNNVSSIGPVRSVRWVDWHILRSFINPILAFAGGINPDVNTVMGLTWAYPANLLEGGQAAGHRISSRVAPDNLYTNTSGLYGLFPKVTAAPSPVFTYTAALPSGATPATSLKINYSGGTDVLWKWDASTNSYVHTYAGQTDIDALTNQPVSTTNIVVQIVHYTLGPYAESTGGSGDVQSVTQGSGKGYILRNGQSIPVTWHRHSLIDPTTYTDASGKSVGLAPGRTWVELVPNSTASAASAFAISQ
jgi:hypothetical protein